MLMTTATTTTTMMMTVVLSRQRHKSRHDVVVTPTSHHRRLRAPRVARIVNLILVDLTARKHVNGGASSRLGAARADTGESTAAAVTARYT